MEFCQFFLDPQDEVYSMKILFNRVIVNFPGMKCLIEITNRHYAYKNHELGDEIIEAIFINGILDKKKYGEGVGM